MCGACLSIQNECSFAVLVHRAFLSDRALKGTSIGWFRLSNHNLMIEKGRYEEMQLCDRTCLFCSDQTEDEFHFLVKCPIYTGLRKKMLDDIKNIIHGFYYPADENFLFWFLLKNPLIANNTGNFIRLSMELRAFLLENRRNNL